MRTRTVCAMVAGVTGVVGLAILTAWTTGWSRVLLDARIPDPREVEGDSEYGFSEESVKVALQGSFRSGEGVPGVSPGFWPGFRGPRADNICTDDVALAESWPEGGPPVLWSVDLGEGHGGPAVLGGRVYLLDYDEGQGADAIRCLSLDDGREIWRHSYTVAIKRNHGISRTVPAVTERYVVTMGPKCHVVCLDAVTGDFRWGIDLVRDYGATVPLWYTGQCPLIDGDIAVIAVGGKSLMVGVDCASGKVVWETPNPRKWRMSHSSVVDASFGGKRFYAYCALGGVIGVAAEGVDRGTVLWESSEWNHSVIVPSPVFLGDGRFLVTAGYGVGSAMCRLVENGGQMAVQVESRWPRTVFASEQQTPLWHGGRLVAVLPNDAEGMRQELVSLRPDGTLAWRSGKAERFGLGPYLIADGKILVMNDEGVLSLLRGGDRYERLARAKVLSGRDSWAPMAMAGGRLLLRDSRRMLCVDLRRSPRGLP